MQVKSYYAASVEQAISRAGSELGTDAVLVHSRRSPAETRHLGPYEVVFALPGNGKGRVKEQSSMGMRYAASLPSLETSQSEPQLTLELMHMRRQMEEIRRTLSARRLIAPGSAPAAVSEQFHLRLVSSEVDQDLASEVADAAAACVPDQSTPVEPSVLSSLLRAEMIRRLADPPAPPAEPDSQSIFAMVGPPGCGKTSCLIKMAVRLSDQDHRSVLLISADPFRIGAADQLRSFAAILGMAMEVAESPSALNRIIEAHGRRRVILIDTPGLSGTDFELIDGLAHYLGESASIRKMLLLPATMRSRDLRRYIKQYDVFRPNQLLFSRVDETDVFGPLYSAAAWSGTPVSYLSTGQQIPEDLEPVNAGRIVDLVLGAEPQPEGPVTVQ